MECKHRNKLNENNRFCHVVCYYCTFQQKAECAIKHPEYFDNKLEQPSVKEAECRCLREEDKEEYWGFWLDCECGYKLNVEQAVYCGGCGKKINVIGTIGDKAEF